MKTQDLVTDITQATVYSVFTVCLLCRPVQIVGETEGTVPFHSIRTNVTVGKKSENLRKSEKSRKNLIRVQKKMGVTRDVRID